MTRRPPHSPRLCLLLGLLLAAPVLSAQGSTTEPVTYVTEGDTKASVIQRLGGPTGTAAANNREILTYPQGEVILVDGKVVQVRAATNAPATPQYRPTLPRATPAQAHEPNTPPPSVRPRPTSAPTTQPEPPRPLSPARQPTATPPVNLSPSPVSLLSGPLLFFAIIGGAMLLVSAAARIAIAQRKKLAQDLDGYAPRQPAARRASPPYYAPPRTSEPPPIPIRPVEIVRPAPSPFDGPLTFELIDALEWRRFEELSAAYFRAQGLRAVCNELSRQDSDSHGDGGIDIRLYRDSRPEPYAIVQCKARSKESDLDMVRAFFGVMAANRIANGYYVSCNGFTGPACDFARDNGVTRISGQQLLDSLNYLPAETIASIRRDIWRDDYHTPTCPRCGSKMVRRESATPFWGCSHFPSCKHRIEMRASER